MARLIAVDDPGDPRLSDYISLRDVELRKHLEAENGFFIAEGEKVVRRAVAAGYSPRSFLMSPRWLHGLEAELDSAREAPCYVVSEDLAEQVTGFHVHRGALASLHRMPLRSVDEVIDGAHRIVALEDVVDHTNVGAIARNAAAFGIDAMLLSPRCADPLYRRSIKVSMGAVFTLPWTRLDDWYDAVPRLRRAGFTTVALTPAADAADVKDVKDVKDFTDLLKTTELDKLCIILGSEGTGISPRWLTSADWRVRIAMSRGVDSLNVAAASAVAFYATQRVETGG